MTDASIELTGSSATGRRDGEVRGSTSRWHWSAGNLRALGLLALFASLILVKVAVVRAAVIGGSSFAHSLVVEAPIVLCVLLVVDAFFADYRFRALLAVDVAVTLTLAAMTLYSAYYGQIPTVDALKNAGQATTVVNSIVSLVGAKQALLVADIPVLVIAALALASRRARRVATADTADGDEGFHFQHRLVYLALVPVLAFALLGMNAVREMPAPVDGLAAARQKGLFSYEVAMMLPETAVAAPGVVKDPVQLQTLVDRLRGGGSGGRVGGVATGVARDKNVIVIQVEALQAAAIGAKVGGQEVTPNLNKLIASSYYFPNALSEVGRGTTADAEFISNTSLYPSQDGPSSLEYVDRVLPSLPRLLGSLGYDTMTFHTNEDAYWNRAQLYRALGFNRHFDKAYFGDADKISFGASDEVLFSKTLKELERTRDAGAPFYAQIITMSSHHPFDSIPASKIDLRLEPPYSGTFTGRYLQAIHYADEALGTFVDDLEKSGLLKDSVLIVYGDHFGLKEVGGTDADAAARDALLGRPYTALDRMNVPMIVHLPGQSGPEVVETTVAQMDLVPTIADLLGVDLAGQPHFGHSMFEAAPVLVPAGGFMPVGTYADEDTLYVPGATFEEGHAYDMRGSRAELSLQRASRLKWERMRKLVLLSDDYVRSLPKRADYDPKAPVVVPE
jgi:phosphoglycerol transferase MdoB-like AlkP superfamily enzyme